MGHNAFAFFADMIITGLCLLAACKLRTERIELKPILLILFVVTVVSMVPVVGFCVALILFVYLLNRLTDIPLAESIWVVIVSKALAMTILILVGVQWGEGAMTYLRFSSHTISDFIIEK